ncbi:MAG: ABC transporter permease [Opitutaceae bacterium]|jgi:ribose transport system permease protein|nr:ABC transporter permease [Opitutaceae bacterium]
MKFKPPLFLGKFREVLGFALIFAAAIALSPSGAGGGNIFLQLDNLTDILRQQAEVGIIALAMTLVIISGGIDLSVGSLLAFVASLAAMLLVKWQPGLGAGLHITVAVLAALAAALFLGLLNGVVIARLRVQPFVVTLATMIGVRGLARWMTNNTNIDFGFGDNAAARFADFFSDKVFVIGLWVAATAVFYVLLEFTVFGRHARAVGENEKTAGYTGLPIRRTKALVYSLCGLACGVAGLIHAARSYQGNPNDGMAYELDAIAAVVIGGTALSGGKGSVLGTVVGALIMGILTNILRLRLIDTNVEFMIKAVIIVAAVWLQSGGKRRGEKA